MSPADSLRTALEGALADNPEVVATHMAYADHLADQGDPRGELVQVQLRLEDESLPRRERKALQKREQELLDQHLLLHPHASWYGSSLKLEHIRALLQSRHLINLLHLQLRLSDMGDAGVRETIESGILKRLEVLDLRHGCISDEGAKLLAACADVRRLNRLDLQRNRLTAEGIAALRKLPIEVLLDHQHEPDESGACNEDYLLEGDVE